jgi:S-adenosylmethionine:tRNA ribosyltransferase-isomerase
VTLRTDNFDFELPDNLIAHTPLNERSGSRLMVLKKASKEIIHTSFAELPSLLSPDHVVVFNNTKVIKARIAAKRKTGGKVEIFLLRQISEYTWEALLSPQRQLKEGEELIISESCVCELTQKGNAEIFSQVTFKTDKEFFEALEGFGQVPLPPYIQVESANAYEKRYQTVFAEKPGAVAAPTAGLHFTPEILAQLSQKGIQQEAVTLHVGYGTFKPIQTELILDHTMHEEYYEIDAPTASRLNAAKNGQKKLMAVGTTVTRTLESNWTEAEGFTSGQKSTRLFITPGSRFNAIDALITNFHLPRSTLLILVSTFAGSDFIRYAYQEAIKHQYRFYSFGDAMLILP